MVDAAHSSALRACLFCFYFIFTNKPVSALQPWKATALPHGWLLQLCGASRAGTRLQQTLQGRFIKNNQTTSSIRARRWAAFGVPQGSGLAQEGLYSRHGLAEHPFGTRAASALHPAGSPRKMLTNHEWMVLHLRLGQEASRVRAATTLPNLCIATDVTLYVFFPLSLWLLLRGRDARWGSTYQNQDSFSALMTSVSFRVQVPRFLQLWQVNLSVYNNLI